MRRDTEPVFQAKEGVHRKALRPEIAWGPACGLRRGWRKRQKIHHGNLTTREGEGGEGREKEKKTYGISGLTQEIIENKFGRCFRVTSI